MFKANMAAGELGASLRASQLATPCRPLKPERRRTEAAVWAGRGDSAGWSRPDSDRGIPEGPENHVDAGLVAGPLRLEPIEHVLIDTQRDRSFGRSRLQAMPPD